MANIIVSYLKKSVNPGGTPTRLKEWAGFILLVQAMVLYGARLFSDPLSVPSLLVAAVFIQVWTFWLLRKEKDQIPLLRWLIYTGVAIQVPAVYFTDAEIAGTVFFMVWASLSMLSERREYTGFRFGLFVFLLVFTGLALTIYMADDHAVSSATSIATFVSGICCVLINFYLIYIDYRADKLKLEGMSRHFERMHQISESMSEILSGKEALEQLLWKVTQRCIPLLELEDFVIYLYDQEKNRLVQVAAYGLKSGMDGIVNPLEIEAGKGVVGRCFMKGEVIRIDDTSLEPGYIVDDERRFSELAVPIYSGETVVGVMDSEHSEKAFFKRYHEQYFEVIAAFCGIKFTDERARDQMREAELARQLAGQLKELDELKNRFISNISHDLKTPLSLIKGPVQQILRESREDNTLKHAGYILKNTGHLLNMVEQLLQLQRLDHGLKHLYPERFELADLIRPLAEQFENLVEQKQMDFRMECCEASLFTDRFKLQQCIHNLLQNAFRYTGESGRVTLFARMKGEDLLIGVQDDGPGIEAKHAARIFERFYKTDVNNHEGTGIGLSLVKEYMEMIGGRVDFSVSEWGGACFTLCLGPELLESPDAETPVEATAEDTGNPVVLVVEDHPELNEFISTILRTQYQVIQAFDGEQAWNMCREELPDLVLADLMLPRMQGEEVLEKIRNHDSTAHIPVVILSSRSKVPDKVELYALGAENYLVKPFDAEELLAVIENCFTRRRQLQELFLREGGMEAGRTDLESKTEERISALCLEIIRENLDHAELNGQFLCRELGYGRNRLHRELKSATGMAPAEFIRSVRLNEARTLLQNGKMNVSEAAYAVGFNNLSYFTRSFKTQFGYLPSELAGAQV